MARRRKKKRKLAGWRSPKRLAWTSLTVAAVVAAAWFFWPLWTMSAQFGAHAADLPSRVYAAPKSLAVGEAIGRHEIVEYLKLADYREVEARRPASGEYTSRGGNLAVGLRSFPTVRGWTAPALLEIRHSANRVRALAVDGKRARRVLLEPPLLATFHGVERKERLPVSLAEMPEELIAAVLAAEDDKFFHHKGFSLRGIARAAWVNLRGGSIQQGGSTLTQQLVKNLYLTQERTFIRKLREVVLAVGVELRFSKRSILDAYLNEIYWGSSGSVNVMGVGAAARYYFDRHVSELSVAECALLAGIIRSPGSYSPVSAPERARDRRDWVLERMEVLGWLDAERAAAARNAPVVTRLRPLPARRAPFFVDHVRGEARERFGATDLEDGGYTLLSTLDWRAQLRAEEAVFWGLGELEKSYEKDNPGRLETAAVSLRPADGAILAYVGGRDYGASQFDRVALAERQAGSAFKPVVYAAAFEDGLASPATVLADEPLTVVLAGREWAPKNSNGEFRGPVTARTAVEHSLNVPTARLALDVGLPRVVDLARAMGIESQLQAYPSLALGSFEVTPLELVTVYGTLANAGRRSTAHGLRAVLGADGTAIEGDPLPAPVPVMSPQSAYLVTSMLNGVLVRGTGQSARIHGITDPLAGKTGTTNSRRDSWFAGYAPNRVSLVWVGYDDNRETRLSGSRAALPIWSRFTRAVRPVDGYPRFRRPPGMATAVIDPATGELATGACPQVITEVFRAGTVPTSVCRLHGRWLADLVRTSDMQKDPELKKKRRWWRRIFSKRSKADRDPP